MYKTVCVEFQLIFILLQYETFFDILVYGTGDRMKKRFNTTGICIPGKHYMVDTSDKIGQIVEMVDNGDYFVINRPRQYGKTTTLFLLEQELKKDKKYLVLDTSFEGIDAFTTADQSLFISTFLDLLRKPLEYNGERELVDFLQAQDSIFNFNSLGNFLAQFVQKANRRVVLLIDEVDKSSNYPVLFDFLAMLRSKYLKRSEGKDYTFHSIVLAGVHDVKSLKSKIRSETDSRYNSPWNIAVDFKIDLNLFPVKIASMLEEYSTDTSIKMDTNSIAERIYYYSSGYPFLVSKLCQITDKEILSHLKRNEWLPEDIDKAVQYVLTEENTNFESLIKNLENNSDLYDFVFDLIMNGTQYLFNLDNPVIHFGRLYGILKEEQGRVKIHNRIYEQRIYNYLSSRLETSRHVTFHNVTQSYLNESGGLNIKKIILKFQEFMNQQYGLKDKDFLERNGRLLFLAFIRPIINGRGFDFKEVQVSEEKRLDIVITFDNRKYIIELKIWHGEIYHQEGIRQLCDYLDRQDESTGYLLVFDLRKETGQMGKWEEIDSNNKKIYTAWV